ncbi:MAG: phosphotransferase [Candidatus Nealsonbacteria bacterium]|nr:phosphotransferase [Candidatus Nealsonbacteria bacterium]
MPYKIFKAQEQSFVESLFKKNIVSYFPDLKEPIIKEIKIKRISPGWAKETCLVKYKIILQGGEEKIVRGTAERDNSKKEVWKIMKFIYEEGLKNDKILCARPLDFLHKNNMLLYEEAEGTPLYKIIEENKYSEIRKVLKKVTTWLKDIHSLNTSEERFRNTPRLGEEDYQYCFQQLAKIVPEFEKEAPIFSDLVFLTNIQDSSNKELIHGDFYPGNAIIKNNTVAGIDFDKSGLGPKLMDIATLSASFDFPSNVWQIGLNRKEKESIQDFLWKEYCSQADLNHKKENVLLPLLCKVFLDRIYDYSEFLIKGWDSMSSQGKKDFSEKIKSLIVKFKKYYSQI